MSLNQSFSAPKRILIPNVEVFMPLFFLKLMASYSTLLILLIAELPPTTTTTTTTTTTSTSTSTTSTTTSTTPYCISTTSSSYPRTRDALLALKPGKSTSHA